MVQCLSRVHYLVVSGNVFIPTVIIPAINMQRQAERVTSLGIDFVPGDASEPDASFPQARELAAEGVSIGSRADDHHDGPLGE